MERQAARATRVLVADDDARVRSALRLVLEQEPGLVVAGELGSTRGLARRVARARPDVLLLDWEQPGLDRGAMLPALRAHCPGLRVVALASRPDARPGALGAGADYFVAKTDPPEVLLGCLRSLAPRGSALAPAA